jgi:four helix bundle protein
MKGDDIAVRLLDFAVQVLRITASLPKTPEARHIAKQLTRSGTAPGAHYDEARSAESCADFVHKVKIACKEMRESHYWLRLVQRMQLLPQRDLSTTIDEARQLAAILTASANTASQHQTVRTRKKRATAQ